MENRKQVVNKSKIIQGLKLAIVLSLLISSFIIFITFDRKALGDILDNIQVEFFLYILLLVLLQWSAASLLLKTLVKAVGDKIKFRTAFQIYLSGAFVANVTPFASGGAPFQIYFLHKKGVNIGKSTVVVVVQLLLRLFFFGFMTLVFLLFFGDIVSPGILPDTFFYIAFGGGLLVSLGIILLTLLPGVAEKIVNLLLRVARIRRFFKKNRRAKKLLVKARRELKEFRYSLVVISKKKKLLLAAAFFTVMNWSFLFLIMPILLVGLGGGSHFFQAYVMQTIFYLVLPFMPTPGASGIAEIGFASLFVSFIPGNLIGLVMFGWRLFTFYLLLLAGGFFAFREIGSFRS